MVSFEISVISYAMVKIGGGNRLTGIWLNFSVLLFIKIFQVISAEV